MVYIGSCAGQFLALNKATGKKIWGYDITQDGDQTSFHGNPLITGRLIVTGTDGPGIGHLYAFDSATGAMQWRYPDESGYSTDLIRHDSTFFAVSMHDELDCLAIDSGQLVWYDSNPSEDSRPFSSSPALAGDVVFFGTRGGMVKALSADSGSVVWTRDLGSRIATAIVASDDHLYLGTASGYLYHLAQSNGETRDSLFVSDATERSATIGNPALTDSMLIVLCGGGKEIIGVDRSLDQIRWRRTAETNWSSYRPHLWHGSVLIGDEQGNFCALDPASGTAQWTEKFEGTIRGIGSDGNLLFIGTLQGMVYAWEWDPQPKR